MHHAGHDAGIAHRENAPGMSTAATGTSPVARGSARQRVKRLELEQFFADISSRMGSADTPSAQVSSRPPVDQFELEQFFASVGHREELAEKRQRRFDKRRASGFNVFDLIDPDETKLSEVLASLLDPEGSHGQSDLFLRLLFKQLGLGSVAKLTAAATVQCEAPTHGIEKYRRRMDVFVEAGLLLAIENKVDSLDQKDQVKHYLEHLQHCTGEGSGEKSVLIYLTPNGRRPDSLDRVQCDEAESSGSLQCWSYQVELRAWLEVCRQQCAAKKIQDFLCDFITYIESHLKREPVTSDEEEADEN